jgi:hypothetical protein
MIKDGEWVPLPIAARYLGRSLSTLRKWVRCKALKTKKTPGGQHMVRRADMEGLYR